MPLDTRYDASAFVSVIVMFSDGILTIAMTALLRFNRDAFDGLPDRHGLSHRMKEELEDFDVPNRFGEARAPGVEPVPADEDGVRARMPIERIGDDPRQARHVLIVIDDRHPLAMIVGMHAVEPLQHLVPLDEESAFVCVQVRENGAPDRMC